MEKGAFSGYTK